jgi:hypothetical protein
MTLAQFLNAEATPANIAAILATAEREMDVLYANGGHVLDANHVPIFDRSDVELSCSYGGGTTVMVEYGRRKARRRRPYRIYWVADEGRWHMASDNGDPVVIAYNLWSLVDMAHGHPRFTD